MTIVNQFFGTISEIMNMMAPSAGGVVPEQTSEEYAQWLSFICLKYEEASKRGFWRRLLKKDVLTLAAGDTEVLLPVDFQRPNGLYIFYVDEVDLCDPDREPDDQGIFIEMITDPDDTNFGRWRISFTTAVSAAQDAPIWYYCTPPKPTTSSDKILLPGDMVGFGALSEVFRTSSLEGSQDDARNEYENRLNTYLAVEMIPGRNELLQFVTNPRRVDRLRRARAQYMTPRGTRNGRSI